MAKRNWPDHPGIGKEITFNGVKVKVVDVKCGPMFFNPNDLDKPDVDIHYSLKLLIKYPGGHEAWTPPVNGKKFAEWAEKQP